MTNEQIKEAIEHCENASLIRTRPLGVLIKAAQLYLNSQSPVAEGDSLIAAIEGNYSGMSHEDLVSTCKMLNNGRAQWRKEAEQFKKRAEAAEQGLSKVKNRSAQSAIIEDLINERDALRQQLQTAQADAAVMREALHGVKEAHPFMYVMVDRALSTSSGKEVLELIKKLVAALEAQQEAHEMLHAGGSNCPGCLRKQALTEAKRLGF